MSPILITPGKPLASEQESPLARCSTTRGVAAGHPHKLNFSARRGVQLAAASGVKKWPRRSAPFSSGRTTKASSGTLRCGSLRRSLTRSFRNDRRKKGDELVQKLEELDKKK